MLSQGVTQLPNTTLDSEALEGEPKLPKQACSLPPDRSALQINDLTQNLMQAATWIEEPENGLGAILQSVGPQLAAQLTPTVWPEIHQRSRLARVPILMYHDILPEKEVFFDVTPEEFREHLELIKENGLTPVSMDQLVAHLRTGLPLPEKPVLLTFDDGYKGHYDYVLPLLQEYGYPGLFSIYTHKVSRDHGRPGLTWEQLEEMAADPLVTIAAHSVMHPSDLRELSDETLQQEIVQSRQILQERLGIPIRYFTYPEGKYDARVAGEVRKAGFEAALTMNDAENLMAGESTNLLAIDRIGQSQIEEVIADAWGGPSPRRWGAAFDFNAPIQMNEVTYDDVPLILISGGKPVTIHADSRYQVEEIIADSEVAAAVDGGFFSLKYLDSNVMVGPVLSQSEGVFVPGNPSENPLLNGRPLVLISSNQVRFVPFDADKHNTLEGIQAEMADITDAFVAAAWLVKDGQPQPASTFGSLFDFDARRHRAFWGINQDGQPVIGVSTDYVDSISLGEMLYQSGLQDAVMLDSGASTSLAYRGESLVGYTPRPVPHVVGLVPPQSDSQANAGCTVASK
ncbi:MAG: polysaccharide deacetylase family protein [Leptolyngbyaceae cyanobacterium RM1_406_9]|nr:polysaccharide deacetylase family protein [Leptolyngbyaceae cyanobacterium RM1_406_9]